MNRWLRIAGTGASFALFGLGSLLLGLVVFPLLALTHSREQRERRMQRVIHYTFRAFRGFMRAVGVVRATAQNAERLDAGGGLLIVANHPSLIDYVLIAALMPQLDCVVKRAHWTNPATFGVVRGAGYVPNDTGSATVEECARRLRAGRNLLLFLEGTRSPRGGLGDFQRGAAHVALAAGVDAVPVTIRCVPPGLMRGQPWYAVPASRMEFTLDVGEPIPSVGGNANEPGGLASGAAETARSREALPRSRAARSLTRKYREHFEDALGLS